jgi:hypothetical protein
MIENELSPLCITDPSTNYYREFISVQNKVKGSVDPLVISEGLWILRRMRLYHKDLFVKAFDNIFDNFENFLFSEDVAVQWEAIKLVKELFGETWIDVEFQDWIQYLLPLILKLAITPLDQSEQSTNIRNCALECLNLCSNNLYQTEETFIVLIDEVFGSKNKISMEYANKTLTYLLENSARNDLDGLIGFNDWDAIFCELLKYGFREPVKQFLLYLRNDIFKQRFEEVLVTLDYPTIRDLCPIYGLEYKEMFKKIKEYKEHRKV